MLKSVPARHLKDFLNVNGNVASCLLTSNVSMTATYKIPTILDIPDNIMVITHAAIAMTQA